MAIVAAEIAIVVMAFTRKGEVNGFIDKRLEETLHKAGSNDAFYKSWDLLQREVGTNEKKNQIKRNIIESVHYL